VLQALQEEAQHRGLTSRLTSFLRIAPGDLRQEWQNVLIELPGRDPRRWPVVLAAHWDGARSRLDDSYLRALNLNDNASGVAVALEAAAAVARTQHRAPVVVALLDGGHHGHAGADALLSELQGRASAWIELEGVGIPEPWPRHLSVTLAAAGPESEQVASNVAGVFRAAGFTTRRTGAIDADHTGVTPAASRRIPALVIRVGDEEADLDEPPAAEQARLSPELMVLLAKAAATAVVKVAGTP
jgi:Zn-dependent M28 family amino/carboxypeptidase